MNHSQCTTKYETRLTQPKRAAQPSNHIRSTKNFVRNYQRIMQNKPNFKDVQMNVRSLITMNYKYFIPLAGYKNKPNSNPIKPNFQNAKMNVNLTFTKDYRKNNDFVVRINKPNFVKGPKLAQTHFSQRIMKMSHPQAPKKQTQNKANFFKGQNRLPKNLATPHYIQAKFSP